MESTQPWSGAGTPSLAGPRCLPLLPLEVHRAARLGTAAEAARSAAPGPARPDGTEMLQRPPIPEAQGGRPGTASSPPVSSLAPIGPGLTRAPSAERGGPRRGCGRRGSPGHTARRRTVNLPRREEVHGHRDRSGAGHRHRHRRRPAGHRRGPRGGTRAQRTGCRRHPAAAAPGDGVRPEPSPQHRPPPRRAPARSRGWAGLSAP